LHAAGAQQAELNLDRIAGLATGDRLSQRVAKARNPGGHLETRAALISASLT
jgi:hypothetical protein